VSCLSFDALGLTRARQVPVTACVTSEGAMAQGPARREIGIGLYGNTPHPAGPLYELLDMDKARDGRDGRPLQGMHCRRSSTPIGLGRSPMKSTRF